MVSLLLDRSRNRPRRRACEPESDLPRSARVISGSRYDSPNLGRWVSKDPLGELAGANLVAFARNAPVHSFDPLGEAITYEPPGNEDWLLQSCKANATAFLNRKPDWDTKVRDFDSKGCKLKVSCQCCGVTGGCGGMRRACCGADPDKGFDETTHKGLIRITLCADQMRHRTSPAFVEDYALETTFAHELGHFFDYCQPFGFPACATVPSGAKEKCHCAKTLCEEWRAIVASRTERACTGVGATPATCWERVKELYWKDLRTGCESGERGKYFTAAEVRAYFFANCKDLDPGLKYPSYPAPPAP
jgi:RHS repeat-associated protein